MVQHDGVDVRFRGKSGHYVLQCTCPLMTQSVHDRLGVCLRSIQKADRFTFRDSISLSFLHALVIVLSARSRAISALTSDHVRTDTGRSRTNSDDRLPRAALGRVEGGDGLV